MKMCMMLLPFLISYLTFFKTDGDNDDDVELGIVNHLHSTLNTQPISSSHLPKIMANLSLSEDGENSITMISYLEDASKIKINTKSSVIGSASSSSSPANILDKANKSADEATNERTTLKLRPTLKLYMCKN